VGIAQSVATGEIPMALMVKIGHGICNLGLSFWLFTNIFSRAFSL